MKYASGISATLAAIVGFSYGSTNNPDTDPDYDSGTQRSQRRCSSGNKQGTKNSRRFL